MNPARTLALAVVLAALAVVLLRDWPARGQPATLGAEPTRGAEGENGAIVEGAGEARREPGILAPGPLTVAGLRVHCRDDSGRGLVADVYLRSDQALRRLGTTEPSGEGVFEVSEAPCEIVARSSGHASVARRLRSLPSGPVVLVLPDPQALEGVVELAGGGPAPGGIIVVAHPRRWGLAAEGMPIYRVREDPEVASTQTDASGRFRLAGLVPGEPYRLIAGGEGFLQNGLRAITAEAGEFTRLEVARAYATWGRFVEPGGSLVHVGRGMPPSGGLTARLAKSQGSLQPLSLETQLVLPPELADLPSQEQLFLAISNIDADAVGPLLLQVQLPGYADYEATLQMSTIERLSGPQDLVLQSEAAEWGELEVRIESPEEPSDASARLGPVGLLILRSEEGQELRYPIPDPLVGTHLFREIPAGRYQIALRDEPETWRLPHRGEERFVHVTAGTATASFRLENLGALAIDLVLPTGEAFEGEAFFFLGRSESRIEQDGVRAMRGQLVFRRAPYEVSCLAPGVYTLFLQDPRGADAQTIEVFPGRPQQALMPLIP